MDAAFRVPAPGSPWRVKEVAVAQRCTPAHVYDQIAAGELSAQTLGALKLIPDGIMRARLQLPDDQHAQLRAAIAIELAAQARPPGRRSHKVVDSGARSRARRATRPAAPRPPA